MQTTGALGAAGLASGITSAQSDWNLWENPDEVLTVLYFGGVDGSASHYSEDLLKVLAPYLLVRGIEIVYTERQDDLNAETLSNYDAVLFYGNRTNATDEQINALVEFVEDGGGFLPLHSASATFTDSDRFIDLVGGQFADHGHEEMTTDRIDTDHSVYEGVDEIEAYEETYRHSNLNDDIEVLAYGAGGDYGEDENEPFTWVREQGDGRVFYTAWGHDENVWEEDGFKQLLHNAIRWASGNEDTIGDHPTLEDLSYTHVEEYGHPEIPYKEYDWGEAPEDVQAADDEDVWAYVQDSLSVSESVSHTVTPAEFELEHFVSEETFPEEIEGQILDMTFDERGRCWLSVTKDYPNDVGGGNDQIVICEDTDGDGQADDFTVFKDGLSIPLSILSYKDGVIVSEMEDDHNDGRVVYFGDSNGDGVADVEEILFSGVHTNDTHGGLNQLTYGIDNWIWGALGYNDLHTTVDGVDHSLTGQDIIRFKPDGSELEQIGSTASNTAGIAFNEDGLPFSSSATAGSHVTAYAAIPNRYYDKVNGYHGTGTIDIMGENLSRREMANRFLPISERYRQVDEHGGFTAASDHEFYTAREYPEQYWNKTAFVGDGTGQLLATFYLEQDGPNYTSINHNNLVASNDEWVSPTYANVGPDGQVWMIDFYNYIFQHNPTPQEYENGDGNAYETNVRDDEHGRLYRVTYGDDIDLQPRDLSDASPAELVDALTDDNMFWRQTAQRLLVERGETDIVDDLVSLVQDDSTDELGLNPSAIHALWTLDGLGVLDQTTNGGSDTLTHHDPSTRPDVPDDVDHVISWEGSKSNESSDEQPIQAVYDALDHPADSVRLNAVRVLPGTAETREAILDADLLSDEDGRVQQWALLKLSETPESEVAGQAIYNMISRNENFTNDLFVDAATSAGSQHPDGFIEAYLEEHDPDEDDEGENLISNPSFEETTDGEPEDWTLESWSENIELMLTDEETYSGDYSVRLEAGNDDPVDGGWGQYVDVEENAQYRVSGYVKTEDVEEESDLDGAFLGVAGLDEIPPDEARSDEVTGTNDWSEITWEFWTSNEDEVWILPMIQGELGSSATVWWDDISMVQIGDESDRLDQVYERIVEHVEGGGQEPEPTEPIDPDETIELEGQTQGWEGVAPASLEDETNPTLTLVTGETYTLVWTNIDGNPHNFVIRNTDDETLVETELETEEGETQTVEFTATEEMVEYFCQPHLGTMVGDLEIIEE